MIGTPRWPSAYGRITVHTTGAIHYDNATLTTDVRDAAEALSRAVRAAEANRDALTDDKDPMPPGVKETPVGSGTTYRNERLPSVAGDAS